MRSLKWRVTAGFSAGAGRGRWSFGAAALQCVLFISLASGGAAGEALLGGIVTIPPEPGGDREARLRKVAERRARTPILVHRGATRFAPENTLRAYAEAMNHGADGVEIDIRRSQDGILYLLHDDTLDRVSGCTGKARERTYFGLLNCRVTGASGPHDCIPTLASLLVLARQRAMLLHLDVKEPGLQEEIMALIDTADVWDHLVEVNAGNAERIRSHPKVTLLPYKGWLPQAGAEPNREAIRNFLNQAGRMVFCKNDPAWAVAALNRSKPSAEPLAKDLLVPWTAEGPAR